jgi:protein-S-isoprenylcysteine O-methyltransferase Ste14
VRSQASAEDLVKGPDGQKPADQAVAGVIARPPLLFLGALLIGAVADRLLPVPVATQDSGSVRWVVGSSLILAGLGVFVAGIANFSAAATPVPTNASSRTLVTTGIHGRTRNPIYLGMFLVYGGIGIAARSPWTLMLALPLVLTIRYGVVAREEVYLERRFGDAYRDYKARVPRWLFLPGTRADRARSAHRGPAPK